MGWIYLHKEKGKKLFEFFSEEFNSKDEYREVRVLDCASGSPREAYLAVEVKTPDTRKVIGVVCLLDYRPLEELNFGYKDMSEDMGPGYYNCPERILKLLTPTDNPTALEWREECWKRVKKVVLKDGMKIKFKEPLHYKSGGKEDTFTLISKQKNLFRDRWGMLIKIPRWFLQHREWEVI